MVHCYVRIQIAYPHANFTEPVHEISQGLSSFLFDIKKGHGGRPMRPTRGILSSELQFQNIKGGNEIRGEVSKPSERPFSERCGKDFAPHRLINRVESHLRSKDI